MKFVTYENRKNPRVCVHCDGCTQIRKHGGVHKYKQGRYVTHATYEAAEKYALSTGLQLIYCFYCKPQFYDGI